MQAGRLRDGWVHGQAFHGSGRVARVPVGIGLRSCVSTRAASRWRIVPSTKRTIAGIALATACLAACTTTAPICPAGGTVAIVVSVVDGATGLNICGALVLATDGASTFRPDNISDSGAVLTDASCGYDLNFKGPEGARTYTVTATAPGYKALAAPTVALQFDACGHARTTQFVTIKLVQAM
jgi:hypothetical protein